MSQMTQDPPAHDEAARDQDFQSQMGRLAELLEQARQIGDPDAREATGEIIRALMDFHGAALARIVERMNDGGELGREMLGACARDDLAGSLLVLYGLHPCNVTERVHMALEKLRPTLARHGGSVELAGVTDDGTVRLAFEGKAPTCGSTIRALRETIEQAVYDRAPDIAAVEIAGLEQPAAEKGFVSVDQLLAGIHKHA
jgi:Fe-S cluster biogenesis protein NfuA